MSISSKILDAIELLTQNSIKKAAYDKTIQAQIISCQDETIGKYKCRYQDAIIYAYSNNIDTTYNEKAYVYILVPDNDMSKEKTILGTANKLGINYISQAEGEQAYDTVGTNCVSTNASIYLNTAIDKYRYKIYPNENNFITIDSQINNYIKESSSLLIGGTFKTSIQPEKQYKGHYGIQFNLKFIDNETNEEVIRAYILDQDNMIGNPYRLTTDIRQYEIFDIDGQNFDTIDSIEVFCQDFFDAEDPTKEQNFSGFNPINEEDADIFISSLEFLGMNKMTQDEIGGVSISFFTPRGTIFDTNNNLQEIPITAQVKVKGKIASSAQNIPFYWGSENAGIFANNRYYNKYLGKGWKCLNDSNVIKGDQTSSSIVEWVAKDNTYVVKLNAATAKNNKFKVAILYDSNIITKEINIQNLTGTASEITIESDGGTQFYYDNGHPTLTCKIDGEEKLQYNYYWAYQSSSNGFQELTETTNENSSYKEYTNKLEKYRNDILNEVTFIEIEKDNIEDLENQIQNFKYIQRVDKNKIYDVQINRIVSRGTFKCSVYNGDLYLGTAAITLTNKLESQGQYSLVINNGNASFQYNEEGYSPTRGSLENPQQLQSLSFTLYDNLGNIIDSDILIKDKNCTVRWEFPIKDTLLKDVLSNKETDSEKDQQGYYNYYYNRANIIYQISDSYDIKKQRNQIKLFIDYKGIKLNASTNFTFVKTGQPGTNGTQYIVKIVPNTTMDNIPLYPMITKIGDQGGYQLNYGLNNNSTYNNLNPNAAYKFFNVQLWNNGEIIWDDTKKENYSIAPTVKWEILQNKYSNNYNDESMFILNNASEGKFKLQNNYFKSFNTANAFANIVKCNVVLENKTYYGTIPIITAWVKNNNYRVKLKDYTGYRYVLYDSSGKFPKYDSTNPFEIICTQLIKTKWVDISSTTKNYKIDYSFSFVGSYRNKNSQNKYEIIVPSNMFQIEKKNNLKPNQKSFKPKSIYDGLSINNAVVCVLKQKNTIIGKINIPIHFLLNKYGLADINQWDGNNIQIDEDKGFILSPQVGAGKKQTDNSFSGVLMGGVKNPNSNTTQMGLFGYYHGERTIFLNSNDGSAKFGKSGAAQIVIDPSQTNRAYLYSGGYFASDFNGNINYNKKTGNGMLIDLSTPFIEYGNGNFKVNSSGHLTAKGGGSIAGWNIGNDALTSKTGNITLKNNGSIYSNSHSSLSDHPNKGFFLSELGLSIGSKIKITSDGIMYLGQGAVKGNSSSYWTINGTTTKDKKTISYISYNTTELGSKANSVYLGTDGISLGTAFQVTNGGALTAKSGKIANWTIESNTLTSQKNNDNRYIEMSSSGNIGCYKGQKPSKEMYWEISNSGAATFKNATIEGRVTATSGSIGGWTIKGEVLQDKSGTITLNASEGYITGGKGENKWEIDYQGNATFNKGIFGPWRIAKDNNKKVFEGNTTGNSIRLYANGNIYGQDISEGEDKTQNYWRIIKSQAYFGNGLIIGPMKTKDRWVINPGKSNENPKIYSRNPKASIQFGENEKTASIGYRLTGTNKNKPAITLGSKDITANIDGKLQAKSADIATFDNKTSAIFRGNVTFGKKGSATFNGGVNGKASLSAYIKTIIDDYVNESFLKKIVNKEYLQNYLESASLLSNVVTSANGLSGSIKGTSVDISGYSHNSTVTGLKWKQK